MKLTIVIEGNKEDRTLQKVMAALGDFDVTSANWESDKPQYTHRGGLTGTPGIPINVGDVANLVDGLSKGIGAVRGRGRS